MPAPPLGHVPRGDAAITARSTADPGSSASPPESAQPGGTKATTATCALDLGRESGPGVRCELDGERTHDRCVGICYLNGQDISEVMVRRGLARDCPRFSGGRYAAAERRAAAGGATIGRTYPLPAYCR